MDDGKWKMEDGDDLYFIPLFDVNNREKKKG